MVVGGAPVVGVVGGVVVVVDATGGGFGVDVFGTKIKVFMFNSFS